MAPEDVGQSSAGRLRSISSSDNNIATVPTVSNNGVEQIETLLMPLPSRRQLFIKPDVCYHKSAAGVEYQLPKREKYSDTRPQPWDFDEPVLAPRWKHQAYPLAIRSNSTPRGREVHTSHGDLFPWDGTQPEDHLNISIIQDGFFDQYLNVQPEPVSARTSIVTGIRNKMGLTHLSQSLISALTIRGERGHITMPSTFKPPPRVTLTDTKREVWLKDLSDRNISLRRLSRTIPHGIRGRMLLEHCLSKGIPLSRVIWLSKCVGANELRSFRRKGALALSHAASAVSGEFRYIRDWTASLEQFVGCLKIPHLNDVDWLSRMTYS
jgi:mediator of RNA polymerase II transcription subunit 12